MIRYNETLKGFGKSFKVKKQNKRYFEGYLPGRFTETVKPNRRMRQSDFFCLESVNDASKVWHKAQDLAENSLALCTTDENTTNFSNKAVFLRKQQTCQPTS